MPCSPSLTASKALELANAWLAYLALPRLADASLASARDMLARLDGLPESTACNAATAYCCALVVLAVAPGAVADELPGPPPPSR